MDQVFGSPGFAPFLSETALPQRLEKWTGLLRFPALRLLMADKRFESRPPHGRGPECAPDLFTFPLGGWTLAFRFFA